MSQVVARAEAPEIAGVVDPVWAKLRQEAEAAIRQEPSLTSFILTMILNHDTLESAVTHRVAARLGHPTLSADLIGQTFCEALAADPAIGDAFPSDLPPVADPHPAPPPRLRRPRPGLPPAHRADALLQGLPRSRDAPPRPLAVAGWAARF